MKTKLRGFVFIAADAIPYAVFFLVVCSAAVYYFRDFDGDREAKAYADTAVIGAAVSQYHYEIGHFPSNLQVLLNKESDFGPWVTEIPLDPWKHSYQYKFSESSERFSVYSYGSDGTDSGSSATKIANGDIGYTGK